MLDIKFIRENAENVKNSAKNKGVDIDIEKIIDLDEKVSVLHKKIQTLQEERNSHTKQIAGKPTPEQIEKGKSLKEQLENLEKEFNKLKEELNSLLLGIPNPAKPDVKVGKDESENEVIKTWGEPTKFPFKPKDHLELGELLGIIDMERASKVSGSRFTYIKGDGALLELSLTRFAIDFLVQKGFTPVIPPTLIKKETMQGLGYMEQGGEEDMYKLDKDNLILVGTAEQSVVPMHMNEILDKKVLPLRYVGYSSSFRREAGSYGKDTRGILRMHQFNKVEMVSFVAEGEDDKEHDYLLSLEEEMFQALEIPYQVIRQCTGDLGFPAARKYDIEAWIPSQEKYREVTSVSTVTDFQSRRLNMKYQDGTEKKYLQVLNGTAFAMSRTPIAILENYQLEDGNVKVPEVLQKYMGKEVIKSSR
jgi:seryl-tRNA synthetase